MNSWLTLDHYCVSRNALYKSTLLTYLLYSITYKHNVCLWYKCIKYDEQPAYFGSLSDSNLVKYGAAIPQHRTAVVRPTTGFLQHRTSPADSQPVLKNHLLLWTFILLCNMVQAWLLGRSHGSSVTKWLNRSRCCLAWVQSGPKAYCISWRCMLPVK